MPRLSPRIIYSRHYDIGLLGFEKMHPFDSHKYSRAYRVLQDEFGAQLHQATIRPDRPINSHELLAVHTPKYLEQLTGSPYVAQALELQALSRVPNRLLDWAVLRHMRWGTMGTILAAREAMRTGLAINLSGGYHHAKPDRGEGFCIYADIALAIHDLRASGTLAERDKIVYIDLDAHQGNGVSHCFFDDSRVFMFDMFNQNIYPMFDVKARRRVDCAVPLPMGCAEADYLDALRTKLPPFFDSVSRSGPVRLAIYNAGTDIYAGDTLGGLNVSAEGVLARDRFVFDSLIDRGIPVVMLLSGGYSQESYQMVAATVAYVLRTYA